MSIRGVDAHLMIARAPDFAKEASEQQKVSDRMQNFMAAQAKAEAEKEQTTIAKTEETQKPELHLENESEDNGGAGSSSKKKRNKKESEPSLLDANVGPGTSTIDIKL